MASIFKQKKLYSDRSLGERLKAARKRKKITLEKAEEETKVRLKFLVALEKGDYNALPADVYTLGFLAKYAELLELNKEEIISAFKMEKGTTGGAKTLIPTTSATSNRFIITNRTIGFALLVLLFVGLSIYITYSVKHFTSAPNLEIVSPVAETIIKEDKVEVSGKTDPGATLIINDQSVYIDEAGNFHEEVKLVSGLNNIEVRATNRAKKENVKVIKILADF